MDNIDKLIPFSQLCQLRARSVSGRIDQSSKSDNLLIYDGLMNTMAFYTDNIRQHSYFLLNQRCVAKLNQEPDFQNDFYQFTVFDLWSKKEM
jgi:hypothetical protein